MAKDRKKVLSSLQSQCSRREFCSKDVLAKALKSLDGNLSEAQSVLDDLVRENYVSDSRYACAYAREKASISGWGQTKIRYMLSSKGISSDDISAALKEIDPDASLRKLEKVVLVKYRALAKASSEGSEDMRVLKNKLLRFAVSRGYSYDEASEVIDSCMKGDGSFFNNF